ncbi:tetratricopeptide repeat protein [Azospirillum sp.]|uniref:O-linked N-acetylglucosamine transferase family protein n=1 Tax=Azospirillum sp. TaxID=34012 RepID=UPI003D759F2F
MSINPLLLQAIGEHREGRFIEAEALYRRILAMRRNEPTAQHHLGLIVYRNGDLEEAATLIGRSLKTQPKSPEAHNNLGNVLKDLGRPKDAEKHFREAIRQRPNNPEARNNLGTLLTSVGRFTDAEATFREALRQRPDYPEALYNLANLLAQQGRIQEAADAYRQSLALCAVFPEALNNLGNMLTSQGAFEEAEACYRLATQQRPTFLEAYGNLGLALKRLGRNDAAAATFTLMLIISPTCADAYCGLASLHQDAGRTDEAVAGYARALRLRPDFVDALRGLAFQQRSLCQWDELPAREERMRAIMRTGAGRLSPFAFFCQTSTAEEQLACARLWASAIAVSPGDRLPAHPPRDDGRIRVGYLSADFHDHATAYLMAELFERHDRARFEIRGYSYGPDSDGAMRCRLLAAFDAFTDVRGLSNVEAARRIHQDGVDILVDLKGYTNGARSEILAYRPAPIQVNFLGFPGTMGAEFVDYLIADPFITPPDRQEHYAERLVLLPDAYQPNDRQREIAEHTPSRTECGLPERGLVFCSFNGLYKITPEVFAVWMRLLTAVPNSVLWLMDGSDTAKVNLRREAERAGVGPARLLFAPVMRLPDHLARFRHADLFLDTFPVNAHTTASDALWAGVPVLTCAGETFISRVAGSLVTAVGLPELVVSSLADYEAAALGLARDRNALAALRQRLARNRDTTPLFDSARFARHLEDAFAGMWEIRRAGGAPRPFAVPSRPPGVSGPV